MTTNKKNDSDDLKSFCDPYYQIFNRLMELFDVSAQDKLAGPLGVSQSTVSRWYGKRRVPKKWVAKVVEENDVNENWLIGDRTPFQGSIQQKPLEKMSPADWGEALEPAIKAAIGDGFHIAIRSGGDDRSADIHIEIKRIGYDALHETRASLRAAEESCAYSTRKGVTGHASASTSLGTGGRGQIITDLTGEDEEPGTDK